MDFGVNVVVFLHGGTIYPINNIFRRPYLSGCWQCSYFVGQRGDCRYYRSFYAQHVTFFILFVRMILLLPICFFGQLRRQGK